MDGLYGQDNVDLRSRVRNCGGMADVVRATVDEWW